MNLSNYCLARAKFFSPLESIGDFNMVGEDINENMTLRVKDLKGLLSYFSAVLTKEPILNDVANINNADLIVMGSHGTGGVKDFFVGSNTEKVVRNADIPVLVVKNDVVNTNFETVVFATDFDEECINAYLNATKLFDKFGSSLKLLYVNQPNELFRSSVEIEKRIANFLQKADGNLNKLNDVAYQADYSVEQGVLN